VVEVEVVEKSRRGLRRWMVLPCLRPAPPLADKSCCASLHSPGLLIAAAGLRNTCGAATEDAAGTLPLAFETPTTSMALPRSGSDACRF
jgi:hypothetical protein